jgi:hypothetical protein
MSIIISHCDDPMGRGRCMPMHYKLLALEYLDTGQLSWEDCAFHFGVCTSTLGRWRRKREDAGLDDMRKNVRRPNNMIMTSENVQLLDSEIARLPDMSRVLMWQSGCGQLFNNSEGTTISYSSFCRSLGTFGVSKNMNKYSREIDLVKVLHFYDRLAELRASAGVSAADFVWVDEVGVFRVDAMNRMIISRRGRTVMLPFSCAKMREKVNLLAACTSTGVFKATAVHGCNIDSDIFCTWLEADIFPCLADGMVLVMDGASFHPKERIEGALKKLKLKVELLFTPPYCPFFNPIEFLFGRLKVRMRCDTLSFQQRIMSGDKLYDNSEEPCVIEECWDATAVTDCIWAFNMARVYGKLLVSFDETTGEIDEWGEIQDPEWKGE